MKRRKLYYVIMPFIMALTLIVSLFAPLVPTTLSDAAEIEGVTGLSASDAKVTDADGKTVSSTDTTYTSRSYTVLYHWTIPDGVTVKDGDTMTFTIPSNIKVTSETTITVLNKSGAEVGTATIGANATTGTIKINNVQNLNISDREGNLEFGANGTTKDEQSAGWMLNKAAWETSSSDDTVTWQIVYNPDAKDLNNVDITDTIGPNQEYVEGSLKIEKGTVDSAFQSLSPKAYINNVTPTVESDGNSTILDINIGSLSTAISITYQTKPDSSFKGILKNEATDNNGNKDEATKNWNNNSGDATGTNGSVTLKKVSSTDTSQKLANATFKIVKYDNNKVGDTVAIVTTDKNGEASYDKLANGTYAFVETTPPDGYELDSTPHEFSITKDNNYSAGTIIVKDTPTKTTSVTVNKEWDDFNNAEGKRPSSIKLQLYKNGDKSGDPVEVKPNVSGDWTHTFENLPKVDSDGNAITYSVQEVDVPDGYTSNASDDPVKADANGNVTITNTHVPDNTSITVTKKWHGDEKFPAFRVPIDVQLYKVESNGNEVAVGEPVQIDGRTNGNWRYTWNNLQKYNSDGTEIKYTVKETTDLANYTEGDPVQSGNTFTITNTYTPELTKLTVNKVWDDKDDQDAKRPTSVKVALYKSVGDSKDSTLVDTKTIEADKDGKWTTSFTDLPVYEGGQKITYLVKEVNDEGEAVDNPVSGYEEPSYDTSKSGEVTITNTHTPETTSLKVNKVWKDNNDQDGKRPTSVEVTLYKTVDGKKSAVKTITLSANKDKDKNWQAEFTELPVYESGKKITYSLEEKNVEGYKTTISDIKDKQATITNTHIPATTNIKVNKIWKDNSNSDNTRPKEITVRLMANNEPTGMTVTLNAKNNWKGSFNDIPVYANGDVITYSVKEEAVANYITSYKAVGDTFNITNTLTEKPTSKTTHLTVNKVWVDNNNKEKLRPSEITVKLLANGKDTGKSVKLSDKNNWNATFSDLAKKDKNGKEITYTVKEVPVDEYTSKTSEVKDNTVTITNTIIPNTPPVKPTTPPDKPNKSNKPTTPTTPPVKSTKTPEKEKSTIEKIIDSLLPQTGENKNHTTLTYIGLLVILVVIISWGIVIIRKRKNK